MLLLKGPRVDLPPCNPLEGPALSKATVQPSSGHQRPVARPTEVGFLASWPNSGTVIIMITSESPVTAPALASARVPAAAAQSEPAAAAPGRAAVMTQSHLDGPPAHQALSPIVPVPQHCRSRWLGDDPET